MRSTELAIQCNNLQYLISNKHEWDQILIIILIIIIALQEQPEDNLHIRVAVSRAWYYGSYTAPAKANQIPGVTLYNDSVFYEMGY